MLTLLNSKYISQVPNPTSDHEKNRLLHNQVCTISSDKLNIKHETVSCGV